MRSKLLAFTTLLGTIGFGLIGCTPQTINSVSVRADGNEWIVTDPKLGEITSLGRVTQVREGDLLRVQVEVNNRTDRRQGIHYQFIWMDAAGIVLQSPFDRHDEWLEGRQTLAINGVAPDARATQCRLELKRFVQ